MKILEEAYRHPLRGDGITLGVFQGDAGYLATEWRDGTVTVFSTLGLFANRDSALARTESRGRELLRQGYRKAA